MCVCMMLRRVGAIVVDRIREQIACMGHGGGRQANAHLGRSSVRRSISLLILVISFTYYMN